MYVQEEDMNWSLTTPSGGAYTNPSKDVRLSMIH